jgi:GNAT superfamily N-acetyltransferase
LSGLFDFFQSASNAVADNVAGPVDLINSGLGLFGLRSKEPVLGSEWMKRWGLKRDVEMGGARLAGETAGLLSPALLAAKAPQIAKGLLQAQENAAIPRQFNPEMGAIVYHGSPHKFDKFDSSKIGTGEGAQAYGHGLYLADAPDVARSYAQTRPEKQYFLNDQPVRIANMSPQEKLAMQALTDLQSYGPTKGHFLKNLEEQGARPEQVKKISDAWDRLATQNPKAYVDPGNLYKVDLPDEAIAKMLDWDKPLSQQSKYVQRRIEKMEGLQMLREEYARALPRQEAARAANDYGSLDWDTADRIAAEIARKWDHNGSGIWKQVNRDNGLNVEDAAKVLKKAGIPGIRYLDGGSRGAGSGTSNYVVFPGEEGLLSIVERNGQPLRGLMSTRTLDDVRDTWGKSGVTLSVGSSRIQPDIINLSKIEVPKGSRGQGIGTAAMTDLVKFADESGKKVALSPSVDFGASSKGRLVEFYKRFGFVENKGKNKDFTISETMYRLPKK